MWEWGGQLGSWKHLGFGLRSPCTPGWTWKRSMAVGLRLDLEEKYGGGAHGGDRKQLLDLSEESLF